jgi:hypothetical protein
MGLVNIRRLISPIILLIPIKVIILTSLTNLFIKLTRKE